jgi:hypothetical protein
VRGFILYIFAGVFIVLAMDMVAPPVGLGLSVVAWPAVDQGAMPQVVNRVNKSDRLQLPINTGRRTPSPRAPAIPVGCEPVFSALSSSAYANYPGRCAA